MVGRVKSSLAGKNTKVSKNLAKSIDLFSINSFTLITVEEYLSERLTKNFILLREQFWMLLYPTLNISLLVSSNDGSPMAEEKRINLPTIKKFYQYEVNEGVIISGSEKIIYGMKELARTGVISLNNTLYPIEYNSVKGHLTSGLLWKNKFLFTAIRLTEGTIVKKDKFSEVRATGVWIYDYRTREFINYEASVKSCLSKYDVSPTHFKRIRKFGLEFKGYLFSNEKLH